MPTDKINYSHGDTGSKPADGKDFVSGDPADPEEFDWYINTYLSKINSVIGDVHDIINGVVTVGTADNVESTYKGNDIDSNADGKVDAADSADNATNVKGNDIDTDGDGIVNAADDTTTVKGNDIDTDGDGIVNEADHAATSEHVETRGTTATIRDTTGGKDVLQAEETGAVNVPNGPITDGANNMLLSVPATGQVTLSSGEANVGTGITATDATFLLGVGVDDPDTDVRITGRLFWDDSVDLDGDGTADGEYRIEFIEDGTNVGNPTINYDIIRIR